MEDLIDEPANRGLKKSYDSFLALARERFTTHKERDSWDFSEMAATAMEEFDSELEKTQTWKELWIFQKGAIKDDLHRLLLKSALSCWRNWELRNKDRLFAARAENTFPKMQPDFIGLDASVLESSYFESAVNELRELNNFHTPDEVVQILSRCKSLIQSEFLSHTSH